MPKKVTKDKYKTAGELVNEENNPGPDLVEERGAVMEAWTTPPHQTS